uniref:Uncharacterized protein n=1 Tax=Magallana gigas TaxID=29159 RepID=A0A8W8MD07_MAGGI
MAGICLLELLAACILFSTVLSCPNNCNGRGTCDRSVVPNQCRCQPNYIGEGCEFETFEETRMDPFTPLVSLENIDYLPFAVSACGNVYFELRRSDTGGYGFELGGPGIPFSSLDRVPSRETGQLDTHRGPMMDCQNFREFWLDWDTGMVRLGTGSVRGQNVVLNSPSEPIPGISQIIFNSGSWKLPLQYKAPLETNAQMSEFNGVDIQGNTGMMQQGSPMVIGGVNQPVSDGIIDPQGLLEHRLLSGNKQIDEQGNIQYKLDNFSVDPSPSSPQGGGVMSPSNKDPTVVSLVHPTPKIERLRQVQKIQVTSTEAPIPQSGNILDIPNSWADNSPGDSLSNLEQRVFSNEPVIRHQNEEQGTPIENSPMKREQMVPNNNLGHGQSIANTENPSETVPGSFVPPTTPTSPPISDNFMPSLRMLQSGTDSASNSQGIANKGQNTASLTDAVFSSQEPQKPNAVDSPSSSISRFNSNNQQTGSRFGSGPTITSQKGSVVGVNGQPIKSSVTDVKSNGNQDQVSRNLIDGPDGQLLTKVERIGPDGQTKVSFESPSQSNWPEKQSIGSKDTVKFDNLGRPMLTVERKSQPVGPVQHLLGPNGEKIEISRQKHVSSDGSQYEEQQQQKIVSADGAHVSKASKLKTLTPDTAGVKDITRQEIAERNRLSIKETENQKILKPKMLEIKKRNREETHRPDVAHIKEEKDHMSVDVSGTSHFHKSQHQELIGPNRSAFSSSFSTKTVFAPRVFDPAALMRNNGETTTERVITNDMNRNMNPPNNPFNRINTIPEVPPIGQQTLFSGPRNEPPNSLFQNFQRVANSGNNEIRSPSNEPNRNWRQQQSESNPNEPNRNFRSRQSESNRNEPNRNWRQQSESNPNEPNRDWRPQQSEANPGDQFRSPQSPNNFWRESRGFNGPDTGNRRDSRNFNEGQRVNRGDFISPGQINPQSDRDMRPNNFDGQNVINSDHITEIQNPPSQQWFIPNQQHIVAGPPQGFIHQRNPDGPPQGFIHQGNPIETHQVINVPTFGSPPWGSHLSPHELHNVMQPPPFFRAGRSKRQAGVPPPPPSFDNFDFSRAQRTPQTSTSNNILGSNIGRSHESMNMMPMTGDRSSSIRRPESLSNVTPQPPMGMSMPLNNNQGINSMSSNIAPPPPPGGMTSSGRQLFSNENQGSNILQTNIVPPPPMGGVPSTNQMTSATSRQESSAFPSGGSVMDPSSNTLTTVNGGQTQISVSPESRQTGQFVQGQTMFAPNQMGSHTHTGTTNLRQSPIEEVNLSSGRSLEIECGIKSADPNLEIKWTKNGVPWTPPPNNPKIYFTNNKRKIVFESVTEEDNGNYMCVANNLFKTSSTTDLFLDSPESAMIVHEPTRLSPTLGKRLEILCDIHSTDPNLKISWMKDGRPFNPMEGERISFYFDNKIIVFNAVEEGDKGKYTCRGSDGYVNPTSIIVNVLKPESNKFTDIFGPQSNSAAQQAGQLINTGALQSLPIGSGYFEIVCNANPNDLTSAIRWTKNGKPFNLNPQNPYVYFTRDRRKIIFENLSPADNGIYTCYLNDTDVSSASTDLFIENANDAMVSFMPETKHPMVGGILELRCDVTSSDPNVQLSWTKNSEPLLPGRRVIMQNKNSLVTVYNVTAQDSGQYKCIANGDLSTAVSTFVNVHSKEPGTVASEMDNNKFASLFGNTGGGQFFLGGNRMSGNQMVQGSVLGGGQMVQAGMRTISQGPMEEKVISSGYFEINCNIPGTIDGEITWLKDGNVYLIPSNRPVYFKNNKKTIVFLSVAPEDNGLYTCIVNNQYQASASTELFIKNKEYYNEDWAQNAVVVHEPQTLNPVRGTRLELTCDITTTNPNIRLTWLKNGVPVQPTADRRIQFQNYNQLLLFDPVVPGDEGKYTCQANDPMRTSVSTFVKVHEREESRTMYATMSLSSGSTIQQSNPMQEINIKSGYFEINCLIDSGNAEIFWAKNGQPFNPPAGRAIYFADNKKKIVFESVKEEDSGLYTCVAKNEYLTSVSTDLFIEGNSNTAIVVYVPQRLNPIIGSRLEITCSVHDHDSATNPNMQVTWFKENVPIAAENNPNIIFQQNGRKMILRSVSASDQGNYMCAVNDPNVTPVVMYIQPHANAATRQRHFGRFLGQAAAVASSRIPIEAGNLRIQCDVADDSTSSIAWFKDNRPLDDTLPNVAFEDDFRRLVLLAFGPSDRGVYMCLTGGQNWHSAAQELIYINSDEAGVTTKPMKIYPIFNSAVEIKCRIPGLQPTDAVSWEYEGIPLVAEPEQVVLMDNDQTLWIKSFQPSDVGRYTCKANGYQWSMYLNGYSTPLERSAALGNPMFMESLYWMYGPRRQISFGTPMPYPIIGGRVEIMCGLQISNPNTIIRWLKDGRPLQRMKPTYYMYNGRSLVLFGFSAADNGRYTCVANDGSMSSASTSLSYRTPESAMATYEPPNVNPLMGRRAEIVCNIQNLPADVTVQWLKDGIPFNIQSARVRFLNNNRKIEFSPVYASDAGSYECVADTEQREAYTTSVKVFRDDNGRVTDVYGDPTFLLSQIDDRSFPNLEIGSPMDLPTRDGVVELYCGVKNPNPNAVFTWMKDGRPITRNPVYYKNDGRVLVIPDFEPADNGRYTCITNDNILSSSSTLLNYVSPALASATYQPPRLNPITGRKVVVKCSIPNLPPGVSVSWIKNGQPFQPPAGRARLVDNNRRIEFSYVYPEDAGSYTCMATDGSTLSHSTGVNVYKNDKDRTNTVYGPAMTITPVTIPEPGTGPYPGQPIAPSDGSVPQGQLPGQPIAPGPYIPEDNIPTGQVPEQPIPPGPYVAEDNLPTGQLPEAPIIPPDFPRPLGTYVPQENVPTGILPERTLPSPDASIPQGQPLSYPIDGGVMYLRCGIQTNDPNILIRWLKDGRPIRRMNPTYYMYNGRILVLMGVNASDNGRYTCVANDRTMSSSSTNLQYENPGSATATYNPPKLNPVTGDKAEIYCNIPNLDPGYQITWLKDGQRFEPQSQRVQLVANSRKLEFSSVYPEDAGTYTCTANDEMGTSYTTDVNVYPDGTLRESDVYGSPTFLLSQNDKPKEDLTIGSRLELPLDSGTAEMLCGIQTNNPNAIFTWLKDGQPITRTPVFYKDDGRVLVLPNFTPADNGKYTCVTNDKSMSSSSTDIQYVDPGTAVAVYEPPEMNPLTDDKTELFCDISNLQPFDNVRWFKDGNPFEVQNQRIQIVDRNRKIEFSSVFPEDAGTYTCQSDEGKSYSVQLNPFPTDSERKVTVYGPDKVNEIPEPLPDEFLTPTAPADRPPTAPDTGIVTKYPVPNTRFELRCAIPNLSPGIDIEWKKNGQQFLPFGITSRIYFLENNSLVVFRSILPSDSGDYTCIADYLSDPSQTTRLQVQGLNPDGSPRQPSVYPDGVLPDGSPRQPGFPPYTFPRSSPSGLPLPLPPPVPQSMGGKKPQAIDPFPSPRIDMLSPERSPVTVTAKEGEPYVLECDTPWRPNDQISWYKNEVPLQLNRPGAPAQMENNLVFQTIRPTDRGKYTCTVNNNLQTATTILLDTVPADPSVIGNQDPEQLETREGNAYTLTCKLPNIRAEDTISWYKNGDPVRSSDNKIVRGAIEFKPVRLADRGSYYCVKNNDLGSTYAADLNVLPRDLMEEEPKAFVFTPVRPSVPLTPGTGQPIGTPVVPTPVDDFDSFRMPPPPPPIDGGLGPLPRPGPGPIPQVQRPAVPTSPITQVDPRDVEISPGHFRPVERTRFILECAISRTTGKVIWMKDGKSLSSEQPRDMNGNLIFGTVRMSDGGQYTCISDDRSQTYNAAVDVLPDDINTFLLSEKNKKPELRVPMLNYHRPMTETPFQLECDIPGADYQYPIVWFKDGQRINLSNPSPRAPQPRDNGRALVFRSMLLSHSGVYSCQVGPEERTDIVDVRPESVQEYLLLSGKDDDTPNALLPEGEQLPSLTLPNSENSPKIKMAERGTMAVIKCETGYNLDPNAPIFWFKNKDLIAPSQRIQLRNDELLLSNVMPSDAALYTCVVGDGEATSSTRLFVTEPSDTSGPMVPEDPRIPQGPGIPPIVDTRPVDPSSVEISPGHFRPVERTRFNLECAISRTTGKVIWMKDGRSLGNELPQDMNGNLIFGSVRMSDGGQYTCISDDRSQTYNAAVDVLPDDINTFLLSEKNKKPELRVPMLNYHRPMTETPFQLECDIPGADYQYPIEWFKDGQRINLSNPSPRAPQPRDNGRVLVFRSMLLPHSGVYSCRVGPEERTDIVDVRPQSVQEYLLLSGKDDNTPNALLPEGEQLPSLTLPNSENSPKIKMAERGTMAVIKCDSGFNTNANAPVFWFKNTELIAMSPRVQIRNDELLIEDVLPSDAALYTCVLGDGEATSSTRLFVTEPSDQTGPMIPEVPRRPPSIDPRIPPTPGSLPLPGSRLPPLPPPYLGDRDRGFPDQGPAGPEPISPNDPQISPGHFRPIETTSFLLECKVPRNGGMVYWLKDGKVIPNPPVTRNMDLVMSPVQRRDSGVYTCVSEDRRTVYEAAVDVIPTNVYEFVQSERNKNPEDRRANIDYYRPKSNSVFNLNCDIPGADLRQPVIWTKDGGPLDASKPDLLIVRNSGRTLGFPSILRNQAGVYSCRIGNNERVSIVDVRPEKVQEYLLLSETDDESPTILLPNRGQTPVLRLPEEDSSKLMVAPAGSDVLIKCDVALNADPNIPVYWYKNGQLISEPQTRQIPHLNYLSVTNTDDGLYTCVLGNGDATSSTRLYVTDSLPDVPIPSGPRDQTSPRDGPFAARDVRPQIDPTDRLPQIDPPERLPPIGPGDRLPPVDPRGRLPNPGDRPVSPSGVMPPIPLPPIPRDPFDRNQETPISPYPKGSEPGFTDTQEGRYPLPNLEIPGQINDPLLTEGPDTPSEPDARTVLSQVNPEDRIDPLSRRPPVLPDTRNIPPVPTDRTGPIDPRGTLPTGFPTGPGTGGRFVVPSLGGIIEQFFYPRISQDFTLPCNIKGITANTPIVWYKGDQRFIPDSRRVRIVNNAIVFRPAIAEDSGSYSCMRPDTLESIRAQLYVNGDALPPGVRDDRFSQVTPTERTGSLVQHFYYPSSSELFELRCDLKSGDNRVPIRWLKNGQPFIVPVDRPVSLHENNHVIRFSSISPRDNGRYTCIAGDNLASVSSEIVVKRPDIGNTPWEKRISLSSNDRDALLRFTGTQGFSNKYFPIVKKPFILNCTAAEDTPMLPVRWLRNGQPFLPDGQRVFPRSSSLVFSSILPDDSGHYTCIVGDNQKAENVIVDVIFHDMSAEENTPARPILRRRYLLTCGITSLRPNTQITWFKDGQPFNANNDRVRFIDNKRGVLFTSLLEQDNGEYMCIANYGSSRASYTTTVNAAEEKLHEIITVPLAPTEHRAPIAERFTLECVLSSVSETFPPIWMKDGRPFDRRSAPPNVSFRDRSIVFDPLTPSDEGRYTCASQDGSDQYTSELIPVPRVFNPTEGRPLSVRCLLPGRGPVTWTKNGQPFPNVNSRTTTFSDNGRTITFTPVFTKK